MENLKEKEWLIEHGRRGTEGELRITVFKQTKSEIIIAINFMVIICH